MARHYKRCRCEDGYRDDKCDLISLCAHNEACEERDDQIESLESDIAVLRDVVNEQADDEGLWFIAQTASEAYVQAALRRLHEVIEGKTSEECARELVPVSKKVSKWIAHPPDRKATVSGRRDK